jgi:sarcosine oxidase, subunit alpha
VGAVLWHLRGLLRVGFYYKMLKRGRSWLLVEPLIRRMTGIGSVPRNAAPRPRERLYHFPELCVIGGGVAGLSAALAGAERGVTVIVAEEGGIGEKIPPGMVRRRVDELHAQLRTHENVTVLENGTAIGIYEGPLVPVVGPDALHLVQPSRVVVATGASERHPVFPGNDLVGVWLGRGAARLAGAHKLDPGSEIVYVASTEESLDHLELLRTSGVHVAAVVVPDALSSGVAGGVRQIRNGEVVAALGRTRVRGALIESPTGAERVRCDGIVLSLGLTPRAGLLRQAPEVEVVGAGDVVDPGCGLAEAEAAGREAGATVSYQKKLVPVARASGSPPSGVAREGVVCLCEDVRACEMDTAWREGFQSTELLKRYTTATMGPCQGAMCHDHLRTFVKDRSGSPAWSGPTTARPPARPVLLEDLAAGVRTAIEHRTGLHERHEGLNARMEWAGAWKRPDNYGDVSGEYSAVRHAVSIMDIGTLGKYYIAGPDATEFLDRVYPCSVRGLKEGRLRYTPALNEAGYVFDESLICSLGSKGYFLTFTSSGAGPAEAWLREWAREWGSNVYIVNQTATLGTINLAGPRARELLARLTEDPVDPDSFPYTNGREIEVAGVPCLALRVGFVGELSYELHHPALRGPELWDALMERGTDLGIRSHGLDALKLLRLEKGHIIVGQDTDFDSSPAKLGLEWAIKMTKTEFIGKPALERMSHLRLQRRLAAIRFDGRVAPVEGAQLFREGEVVGYLTSSRHSPVLGYSVALGWLARNGGDFPDEVVAMDPQHGSMPGRVVTRAFYDPEGARVRA